MSIRAGLLGVVLLVAAVGTQAQSDVYWNDKKVVSELATLKKVCVMPILDPKSEAGRKDREAGEAWARKVGLTPVDCLFGKEQEDAVLMFGDTRDTYDTGRRSVQVYGSGGNYTVNVWPHIVTVSGVMV